MKKLILSICAIAAISLASAQEKQSLKQYKKDVYKHHEKGGKHGHSEMVKDLNLSEDQKKQLKTNHEEYRTKLQALDKEENITVKEMRERKAALHKDQKAKNEALYTSEQKEKIAQAKLKREEESKQHAEKRLAKMKTNLSLSDDQVARLKAQDEDTHAKIKAIRENQSLDEATKREQMMALKNNAKEQRKTILTAEQAQKMEELKKQKKQKI